MRPPVGQLALVPGPLPGDQDPEAVELPVLVDVSLVEVVLRVGAGKLDDGVADQDVVLEAADEDCAVGERQTT